MGICELGVSMAQRNQVVHDAAATIPAGDFVVVSRGGEACAEVIVDVREGDDILPCSANPGQRAAREQ